METSPPEDPAESLKRKDHKSRTARFDSPVPPMAVSGEHHSSVLLSPFRFNHRRIPQTSNGTLPQDILPHRKTVRKTGGLNPPTCLLRQTKTTPRSEFSARPAGVLEVVAYSLKEYHCHPENIQSLLDHFGGFDAEPAMDIVTALSDSEHWRGDWSLEAGALQVAFRFIRYNNFRNWPIGAPWRSAFKSFMAECEKSAQGAVETPQDWCAVIADERPDDQETL